MEGEKKTERKKEREKGEHERLEKEREREVTFPSFSSKLSLFLLSSPSLAMIFEGGSWGGEDLKNLLKGRVERERGKKKGR